MASSCFVICVFIAVWIIPRNADCFVKMECSERSVGQFGHQSMLMCVIKPTEDTTDVTVRVVTWKKGDNYPLSFTMDGQKMSDPGCSFAESSWNNKNLNVSLLIINTKVEDDGDYTCKVATDSGNAEGRTTLKVTAKYSSPTVKLIKVGDTPTALHCNATGGYPAGTLRWFDGDGTDWTKSSKLVQTKMSNGLFHLSSELQLSKNSIFPVYTCVVYNASGGKEEEVTSVITPEAQGGGGANIPASSKIAAPLVVIGSLIVGLLALLLYRRRSQQLRRPSTTPLMGPHREIPTHEREDDVEDGGYQGEDENHKDDMA